MLHVDLKGSYRVATKSSEKSNLFVDKSKIGLTEKNMTTKRFLVQFAALFCTLLSLFTFAVAKNAQNKECPMEENDPKTSASCYETPVLYFNEPGPRDTGQVLECVRRRAQELNIKWVLVASVSGDTALRARQILAPETNIIAVSHVTGFVKPNHQEMSPDVRQQLIAKGISVLTAPHAFGGVGRGIRKQLGAYQVDEIVAYTLRIFGQGTKVAMRTGSDGRRCWLSQD